ncbi:NACHT domain-containing protein [Umezawaea endophytica]|uniref:NACHT domain-containing protein n=1 Tax=Umezawaea endophytica TaxID=1654476 RepID=A0A9X3AJ03_9PSEU|nr:NACHT domain-containing protein [Umezawaea endophytica]MCS7483797.1 NACHT domain-containing protein [Umezawaea endophytica]
MATLDPEPPNEPTHPDDAVGQSTNNVLSASAGTAVQVGTLHGGLNFHSPPPELLTGRAALLAEAADRLADAVRSQWRREEARRQVREPVALPVRWRSAANALTDARGALPDVAAGGLGDVARVFRELRFGRLVVLGAPGSGKTVLALRVVLELLGSRADTDPVPVVFSLGSWDPTVIELEDWLVDRLTLDHTGLDAVGPDGKSLAAALVETGRVLPVLDGFDEIAVGLHRDALKGLTTAAVPLVLTSRTEQYEAAASKAWPLSCAAAIELVALTPEDLVGHVPPGGAAAWTPVLDELRAQPRTRAAAVLAEALSTPLMVTLAHTAYGAPPGRDPAELLDPSQFPTPEAIEAHLLADYTLAVYRRPTPGGHRKRWEPERAEHWLGYLARHLTELRTPDLHWWHLGETLGRRSGTAAIVLVSGLLIGLVAVVVETVVRVALPSDDFVLGPSELMALSVFGLLLGILAGSVFGIVNWAAGRFLPAALEPSRVRVRIPPVAGADHAKIAPRLWLGLVVGLVFGVVFAVVRKIPVAPVDGQGWIAGLVRLGVVDTIVYGPLFALGGGIAAALTAWLETPLDPKAAVSPVALLVRSRSNAVFRVLVVVPVFGLVIGAGSGLTCWLAAVALDGTGIFVQWSVTYAIMIGIVAGLGGGIGYVVSATAWGQWLVLARVWLPLTGRMPWAVVAFLRDAHRLGVLRQSGAAYQFRHARLQEHLARTYREARQR